MGVDPIHLIGSITKFRLGFNVLRDTGYGLQATGYGLRMGLSHSHHWWAVKISLCDDWQKYYQDTARDNNQRCHLLTGLINRIKSVFSMYLYIEALLNSLLVRKTSAKLDLKIYLFQLMFDFWFTRLASKKATSCFALARACMISSRNEVYSTSIFWKNYWRP